ncbi:hypothetical protein BH11PSE2_BH11PSE2_11450 [soil metagenome]
MSANVRRMALDFSPLWSGFIGFAIFITMLADVTWLMGGSKQIPLTMLMAGAGALSMAAIKRPIWALLPVSREEIGRANWWLMLGGPLLIIVAGMLIPLAGAVLLGRLHAKPLAIAAVVSGQLALFGGFGCLLMTVGLVTRRFGLWGTTAYVLVGLSFAGVGLMYWRHLTSVIEVQMLTAGLTCVVIAAGLYLWAERLPMAITPGAASRRGRRTLRDPVETPYLPPLSRNSSAGLWGLDRSAILTVIAITGAGATAIVVAVNLNQTLATLVPLYAPLIGYFLAMAYSMRLPVRVLRGLPISGARLAAMINLTGLVILLGVAGVLAGVTALVGMPPVGMAESLALCTAIYALSLPARLRFDPRTVVAVFIGLPTGVFPAIFAIAALAHHGPALFGRGEAIFLAIIAGALVLAWPWGYWEITRGRAAYRGRPLALARWRGAAG